MNSKADTAHTRQKSEQVPLESSTESEQQAEHADIFGTHFTKVPTRWNRKKTATLQIYHEARG
jgi:hypothetical protein